MAAKDDRGERIHQFVERLGRFFEMEGGSRADGLIFAWLMVSESPQSLDDIAQALHVSKATASLGTRLWERSGLIERVHVRRDRKVYYRVRGDVASAFLEAAARKARAFVSILDEGLDAVGEDHAEVRTRVEAIKHVYTRMLRWVEQTERGHEE